MYLINKNELNKFPSDTGNMGEIKAIFSYELIAENNDSICGNVVGDIAQFLESSIVRTEITEIPNGFEQRVLPPHYGVYLNLEQITTGLMLENKELSAIKEMGLVTEQIANYNGIAQQELLELLIEVGVF